MEMARQAGRLQTIVIGGGQAGLSIGYELARRGISFVILDANKRVGDAWRKRWDSLRLFTPARYDSLSGMPFPTRGHTFPTKDEFADYLEAYARHFKLPVETGVRVDRLARNGSGYIVSAGPRRLEADHVVVAMSNFQTPRIPAFARDLAPDIVQLTSYDYKNPSQLREGGVLLVGAGNSGAEIAIDVARTHRTWLAGRDVGQVPFRIEGVLARMVVPVLFRVVFHRIMTVRTPIGRKMRANMLAKGDARIRTKGSDLDAAGVQRVPRVRGVENGRPVLEDGRVIDVANVVWCTGFDCGFSWIDLPIHGAYEPKHEAGVVPGEPGLYFLGLMFLYAGSSSMVHGVGRDAARIADTIQHRLQ